MNTDKELIKKLFELGFRINTETPRACFFDMSGHVSVIKVKIVESKADYLKKLANFEFYYDFDKFPSHEDKKTIETAIKDMQDILDQNPIKKYKAYVNTIDMACSEIFSNEELAQAWVKKMKRRYKSAYPIADYVEVFEK